MEFVIYGWISPSGGFSKGNRSDWGPKPFKFFNAWLDHEAFLPVISSVWNSLAIKGRANFIIKEKLKVLKEALRKWNNEVFGYLDLDVDKAVLSINELETLESEDQVSDVELHSKMHSEVDSKMWQPMVYRESILRQNCGASGSKMETPILNSFIKSWDNDLGGIRWWVLLFMQVEQRMLRLSIMRLEATLRLDLKSQISIAQP